LEKENHNILLAYLTSQERQLSRIYSNMSAELASVLRKYKVNSSSKLWYRNQRIKKEVDKVLAKYRKILFNHLSDATKKAWDMSDSHNDKFVDNYIKGINVPESIKATMLSRNTEAFKSFLKRKSGGFTLSQRVWNITEATRAQLDYFVAEGLTTGRSAVKLSGDIQRYLKQPTKRFRRLRNPETGKLMLSDPAKNYHPGTGVYRSSFKNALRLARNEINIAYRASDVERRKNLPFVLGVQVNLSPAHPEYDICDELQGLYPKEFKFVGWHPNCLCFTTSKLMSKKDFIAYLNNTSKKLPKPVSTIPGRANRFLNDNADKLKKLNSTPYFIEDNFKQTKEGFKLNLQ